MDDINVDELIAIAKSRDVRSTKENDTVIKFIQDKELSSGNNKVPTYVIYYAFKQMKYSSKVGKTEFFRTFNKCFKQHRTSRQRYYLLNDSIELSPEYVLAAKSYDSKTQTTGGKREKF